MNRLQLILRALVPAVFLWIPLFIIAVLTNALWPAGGWDRYAPSEAWQNFITFFLIVTFLWTKAWLILRRMPYIDWLSVSLAAANIAFCGLYLIAMGLLLWPQAFIEVAPHISRPAIMYTPTAHVAVIVIRTTLILILIWSTWMLVNVPDPIYQTEEPADEQPG